MLIFLCLQNAMTLASFHFLFRGPILRPWISRKAYDPPTDDREFTVYTSKTVQFRYSCEPKYYISITFGQIETCHNCITASDMLTLKLESKRVDIAQYIVYSSRLTWHCAEKPCVSKVYYSWTYCQLSNLVTSIIYFILLYESIFDYKDNVKAKTNLTTKIWKNRLTPAKVTIQKIIRSFDIFFIPFTP